MQWQKKIDDKVSDAISQFDKKVSDAICHFDKKYELLTSEICTMKEAVRASHRPRSPISHDKTSGGSTERTGGLADITMNGDELFGVAEAIAKNDVNVAYNDKTLGSNYERPQPTFPDMEAIVEEMKTTKIGGVISTSKKRALNVDKNSLTPPRRSARRMKLVDEVVNFFLPLHK